ncbi:MAG: alkaline phosphatase family protein [Bacteroidota bacterium]
MDHKRILTAVLLVLLFRFSCISQTLSYEIVDLGAVGPPPKHSSFGLPVPFVTSEGWVAYSLIGPETDENQFEPWLRGCRAFLYNPATKVREEITISDEPYLEVIGVGELDEVFLKATKRRSADAIRQGLLELAVTLRVELSDPSQLSLRQLADSVLYLNLPFEPMVEEILYGMSEKYYSFLNGATREIDNPNPRLNTPEGQALQARRNQRISHLVNPGEVSVFGDITTGGAFVALRGSHLLFTKGGRLDSIPFTSEGTSLLPHQINNHGDFVGSRRSDRDESELFLYVDGQLMMVSDLIATGAEWEIDRVMLPGQYGSLYHDYGIQFTSYKITDQLVITGLGTLNNEFHAFLLMPTVQEAISLYNQYGERVESTIELSHPHPLVTIDDVEVLDMRDGMVTIDLKGTVSCAIADIVKGDAAMIREVEVEYMDAIQEQSFSRIRLPVTSNVEPPSKWKPYAKTGRFQGQISIPIWIGDVPVSLSASNVVNRQGYDSFICRTSGSPVPGDSVLDIAQFRSLLPSKIPKIIHNESTDEGFVNMVLPRLPDVHPDFYDSDALLSINDGHMPLKLDAVGQVIGDPIMVLMDDIPEIPNLIRANDKIKMQYGNTEETYHVNFTAHSPPNYYKYAAGTTVKHNAIFVNYPGWEEEELLLEEYDHESKTWQIDLASSIEEAKVTSINNNQYLQMVIALDSTSYRRPPKRVRGIFKMGEEHIEVVFASFEVCPLKTVIIAVDGFAYNSVMGVLSSAGKNGENLRDLFKDAKNREEPALSALPTVTWTNWPGIFSGMAPRDHGITGNSFFEREQSNRSVQPFNSGETAQSKIHALQASTGVFNRKVKKGAGSLYDRIAKYSPGHPRFLSVSVHQWYSKSDSEVRNYYYPTSNPYIRPNIISSNISLVDHNLKGAETLDGLSSAVGDKELRAHKHFPDVLTLYFPGPDNIAHAIGGATAAHAHPSARTFGFGPTLPEVNEPLYSIRDYFMRRTDGFLQWVTETIKSRGYHYACVYALVADHGLHAYHNHRDFNITKKNGLASLFEASGYVKVRSKKVLQHAQDSLTFLSNQLSPLQGHYVYSPNGGMAQIYVKDLDSTWDQPPSRSTVEKLTRVLYIEGVGGSVRHPVSGAVTTYLDYEALYTDLAPKNNVSATLTGPTMTDHGAFGSPPAIFVKVPMERDANSFMSDYQWVKSMPSNPTGPIIYGTIQEFIDARTKVNPDFDWPEFEARLDEYNDKNPKGSRSGDILLFTDGRMGYLAILDGDELNGWHGGATVSESYVPLMLNIPGDVVDDSFIDAAIDKVRQRRPNNKLRNWQLAEILEEVYDSLYD